jgi:hypothetical protein
LKNSSS